MFGLGTRTREKVYLLTVDIPSYPIHVRPEMDYFPFWNFLPFCFLNQLADKLETKRKLSTVCQHKSTKKKNQLKRVYIVSAALVKISDELKHAHFLSLCGLPQLNLSDASE